MSGSLWGRIWPPLFLLTILLAYFAPALLDGRLLAPADGLAQSFPNRVIAAAAMRQGELPFWNPYNFSGMPFLAAIHPGVLFPGNWAFLVLPATWAMNVTAILAFWVAGSTTVAFCRAIGLSAVASASAGLIFMLGGFNTLHVEHLMMVQVVGLLPLVLWAIERFARSLEVRFVRAGAIAIALQVLAGHPQMAAYSLIVAGLYALFRLASVEWGRRLQYAASLVGMVALGVGLTLMQLLPTMDLIAASTRSAISYALLTISSVAPPSLPTLIMPFLFGAKAPSPLVSTPLWGGATWTMGPEGYVGVVGLLFAGLAVVRLRHVPQARFWTPVALVSLLLAMGEHTPLYLAWAKLPVVSMMPYASRHFMEFGLAIAILAGLGLDALINRQARHRDLALAAGALGIAMGAVLGAIAVIGPGFAARTQPYMPRIDLAAALSVTNPALWLPVALLALAAGLLAAHRVRPHPAWAAGAMLVLAADLLVFGYHQGRLQDCPHVPATLRPGPHFAPERTLPFSRWVYPYSDNYQYLRSLQYPGIAALEGRSSAKGYDAFVFKRYHDLLTVNSGGHVRGPERLVAESSHLLDILTVGQLRLDEAEASRPLWRGLDASDRWSPMPPEAGIVVYQNKRALPRAWRVERVTTHNAAEVDARLLGDVGFDPRGEALVETTVPAQAWRGGAAAAETLSLNRIRMHTTGQGPGFVVISEGYDPGWRAFLNDRELPVYRVDALIMGVAVPPGEHQIELRYEPRLWRLGLAGSASALMILLTWGYRRRGGGIRG